MHIKDKEYQEYLHLKEKYEGDDIETIIYRPIDSFNYVKIRRHTKTDEFFERREDEQRFIKAALRAMRGWV